MPLWACRNGISCSIVSGVAAEPLFIVFRTSGDPRPASRRRLAGLALFLFALAGCGDGRVHPAAAAESPGRLVTLPDGRHLNLRCSGHGAPTVLLESGFGADSTAWYKVQPTLARETQVCAYDRAGTGFSDLGPLPRDGGAIARDLDQALQAAGVKGPYILVGHSAGGLYVRLFAARRPGNVQGLILLDPTVERQAPRPVGDGLDGIRRRLLRCLAVAESSPQPPLTDPQWSGCISAKSGPQALKLAREPGTWRGQLSELDSIFGRTSEQVARSAPVMGDIPTYVITASETAAATPSTPFGPPVSIWEIQHQQIAGLSRLGFQTTVISPHLVMIARPEVVIAAAREMIAAARTGRAPAPLPASETTAASGGDSPEQPFTFTNPFEIPATPSPFEFPK